MKMVLGYWSTATSVDTIEFGCRWFWGTGLQQPVGIQLSLDADGSGVLFNATSVFMIVSMYCKWPGLRVAFYVNLPSGWQLFRTAIWTKKIK